MDNGPKDDSWPAAGRDTVVLVNEAGEPTGTVAKLVAHEPPGLLHLAFSVVLYRSDGLVLLQQRAGTKYHFPLAWANSCCSHPRPGEDVVGSAERRVRDELGLDCRLAEVGTFTYRATCPVSGLVEHEFDHVLVGVVDGDPVPDPAEVAALRWAVPAEVARGAAGGQRPLAGAGAAPGRAVAGRRRRTPRLRGPATARPGRSGREVCPGGGRGLRSVVSTSAPKPTASPVNTTRDGFQASSTHPRRSARGGVISGQGRPAA